LCFKDIWIWYIKNSDTVFDFDTQGIDMYDGDWVRARGTTLGADNGLVAAIMAILESTDIPHPAIEALFTLMKKQE
jgi:dipeptidase D